MGKGPNDYMVGIKSVPPEPPIRYGINSSEARNIIMTIMNQRKKNGEEGWPRDILVRCHGNEDAIEIFKIKRMDTELTPVTTMEQARIK